MKHLTKEELYAGLDHIKKSPKETGRLEWIVRRPNEGEREVLQTGELSETTGLVGDNWQTRKSSRTSDGSAHPDMQLNIMNVRAIALLAPDKERWALAGDQLYVDMSLTDENLPNGTQLAIGSAIIQITDQPHNGCNKFRKRFGLPALQFVNSPIGKELHLRGVNAKVIKAGTINQGDELRRV